MLQEYNFHYYAISSIHLAFARSYLSPTSRKENQTLCINHEVYACFVRDLLRVLFTGYLQQPLDFEESLFGHRVSGAFQTRHKLTRLLNVILNIIRWICEDNFVISESHQLNMTC